MSVALCESAVLMTDIRSTLSLPPPLKVATLTTAAKLTNIFAAAVPHGGTRHFVTPCPFNPSQKKLPPLTYEKAVQAVSDQGELKADGRRSTMVYSKAVMTDPSVEHYTQPPRLTFSLHLSPMLAADPAMNGIVSIENASDM